MLIRHDELFICVCRISIPSNSKLILMDSGCLILCRKLYLEENKIILHITFKGNYFFIAVKPIRNALDLNIKKFLEDQLTLQSMLML
jgi:hypothetical protein